MTSGQNRGSTPCVGIPLPLFTGDLKIDAAAGGCSRMAGNGAPEPGSQLGGADGHFTRSRQTPKLLRLMGCDDVAPIELRRV